VKILQKVLGGATFLTHVVGLSSTTVIQSAWKSVEFGEKNAK